MLGPLGLLVGLVLLRWAAGAGLPLPACGFRLATGLPCPGCGSTRALLALTDGDVAVAWRFNPLATVLMLGFGLAGGLWFTDGVFGTRLSVRLGRMAGGNDHFSGRRAGTAGTGGETPRPRALWRSQGFRWLLLLLFANWLYVLSQREVPESSRGVVTDGVTAPRARDAQAQRHAMH